MIWIEQFIIACLFLASLAYIVRLFSPKKGACSKGCGDKCVVANLEEAMSDWEQTEMKK